MATDFHESLEYAHMQSAQRIAAELHLFGGVNVSSSQALRELPAFGAYLPATQLASGVDSGLNANHEKIRSHQEPPGIEEYDRQSK